MYQRLNRMKRALEQRMYLLSAEYVSDTHWKFQVEGSTGNPYTITFRQTGMNCDCPYVQTRHQTCKHMFFIIGRICKLTLERLNTDSHHVNPFSRYPTLNEILTEVLKPKPEIANTESNSSLNIGPESNEDCVICFESMKAESIHKCETCRNYFHKECLRRWNRHNPNCPLCRRRIVMTNNNENLDPMSKLKRETREEKLETVINFLKTKYRPFFSNSENPRKPNTNETRLRNTLEIPDDKTSNQIIQELQQKAKVVPNQINLSKTALEKCRRYNCWLFCRI